MRDRGDRFDQAFRSHYRSRRAGARAPGRAAGAHASRFRRGRPPQRAARAQVLPVQRGCALPRRLFLFPLFRNWPVPGRRAAIADRQRRMTGRAVTNFGVAACAVTTRPPSAAALLPGSPRADQRDRLSAPDDVDLEPAADRIDVFFEHVQRDVLRALASGGSATGGELRPFCR
jgi:hypothetical protein